jgi:hypothetical protein
MNGVTNDVFVSELVSASIDRVYEANLIAKQICRRKPNLKGSEGPGDIIHFPTAINPTANTAFTGTATYEDMDTSEVSLLIDQNVWTGYNIDDLDEFMSKVGLKESQDQASAYVMNKSIDTNLLTLYSGAGITAITDATYDTATAISVITEVSVALDNVHVKKGNKFMVIPPWVRGKLELAGVKWQIKNGSDASNGVEWANVNDVDLYVTTQVVNTGSAATPISQCMFGDYNAICFHPLTTITKNNRESATPLVNKIFHITYFGRKMVRPDLVGYATLTYAAETAM